MSERKIKTAELEVSLNWPQVDYGPLLEELNNLRLDTELTNEEKTAKLQTILHAMLQDNSQPKDDSLREDNSQIKDDSQKEATPQLKDDSDEHK